MNDKSQDLEDFRDDYFSNLLSISKPQMTVDLRFFSFRDVAAWILDWPLLIPSESRDKGGWCHTLLLAADCLNHVVLCNRGWSYIVGAILSTVIGLLGALCRVS